MTRVAKSNLQGDDWKRCIISEGDTWAILDSDCWRQLNRCRGLGDLIYKVTTAIGIRHCDKCDQRRQSLNQAVPFKSVISSKG